MNREPADEDFAKLEKMAEVLKRNKVSRGDVKTVGNTFEISREDAHRELDRVYGHHRNLREELLGLLTDEDRMLKTWYDLAEVYDLWFQEVKL